MASPDFWDDANASTEYMKEVNSLKAVIAKFDNLNQSYEDLEVLIDMALEDNDEELASEAFSEFDKFVVNYDSMITETLLSGQYDNNNAIITLHAGA